MGMSWHGTVWSQSAGDKPSFWLWCAWRHLGHSCGSMGSNLRSTRYSWRSSQTSGRTAHPCSPDVSALLERNTEEENICCVHQAETCLKWTALMRTRESESSYALKCGKLLLRWGQLAKNSAHRCFVYMFDIPDTSLVLKSVYFWHNRDENVSAVFRVAIFDAFTISQVLTAWLDIALIILIILSHLCCLFM